MIFFKIVQAVICFQVVFPLFLDYTRVCTKIISFILLCLPCRSLCGLKQKNPINARNYKPKPVSNWKF